MSPDWQPVHGAKDPCTIRGTINADQLVGTAKADVICGLGGRSTTITGWSAAEIDAARRGGQRRALHALRRPRPTGSTAARGTDTAFIDRKLDKVVSVEQRRI